MKPPADRKQKPSHADVFEARVKLAGDVMRNVESLCADLWKKMASEAKKGLGAREK